MRAIHRSLVVAFGVGLALLAGACAGDSLDDGSGPNVILSISQFPPIPPVTTSFNATAGGCVFNAPPAISVTLKNMPKNTLAAAGAYANVAVDSARVTYVWDDGLTLGPLVQSTSGLIPVNGTAAVPFTPIFLGDLTADRAGRTANIEVTFHGLTLDGKDVESVPGIPGGATLSVNSCVATGP